MHDIISNFIIISVHTENSYELWIYLINRIYVNIRDRHKNTPSTDIITIWRYFKCIRVKAKKGKRERERVRWFIWFILCFLQERDVLSKACHKTSARISGPHHIYNFSEVRAFGFYFFYKNFEELTHTHTHKHTHTQIYIYIYIVW